MANRRILVIHGNGPGWSAVRDVLKTVPDVQIIGEATTVEYAIELARNQQPDLILTSNHIEAASSFPMLAELRATDCPETPIAIFATQFNSADLRQFGQLNLTAYCRWSEITSVEAIRCVIIGALTGELILGTRSVARDYFHVGRRTEQFAHQDLSLTDAERQILQLLAQGSTQKELADRLARSSATIERSIATLRGKFGARNAVHLIHLAHLLDLVPPDPNPDIDK